MDNLGLTQLADSLYDSDGGWESLEDNCIEEFDNDSFDIDFMDDFDFNLALDSLMR